MCLLGTGTWETVFVSLYSLLNPFVRLTLLEDVLPWNKLDLVETGVVDYYPPADICKEYKDIKKEGAYVSVARDRLRIKNPTRTSVQVIDLFMGKVAKSFLQNFQFGKPLPS